MTDIMLSINATAAPIKIGSVGLRLPGLTGATGEKGADGISPHIGLNGNWFIDEIDTGVKAEGIDGSNGLDGITPHIGVDGNWYFDELNTGIKAEGIDGTNGIDGINGIDGKNLEFSWDGAQLGIRQEGQSSYQYVNLKGAKGDKGDDGHTPIKGTDYWTTADQASIVADVLAALPDGDGVMY